MDLGLMFFASQSRGDDPAPYRLMLEAARLGDRAGLRCVWTPERHFDGFGSVFPNPAITSAALAAVTERIQLRAGSAIAPLHDVVRLAEDWAMVDNLSGGRVAVSFGAGWNVNDFIFYPERYQGRHAYVLEQMAQMRALWRGDTIVRCNASGRDVAVVLHPRPRQRELPVWMTASANPRTFAVAGTSGANLLTHLIGQDRTALAEKIRIYREARSAAGLRPDAGIVSLMLHTYIAETDEAARARAWDPLCAYLGSAAALERQAARGGGTISCGYQLPESESDADDDGLTAELLTLTCERYLDGASLIASETTARATLQQLAEIGVDEIACLIDFGLDDALVLDGVGRLAALQGSAASPAPALAGAVSREA